MLFAGHRGPSVAYSRWYSNSPVFLFCFLINFCLVAHPFVYSLELSVPFVSKSTPNLVVSRQYARDGENLASIKALVRQAVHVILHV